MKYDATTHHTTPRNGNCRSSCLLARPQVFNISAYFCTATQFLYFGKLFSRSGIGFPRGGLRREKPPTQSPLFFFFFVLWTVAFAWYARCENKIDVNYAMHTGFTSQTPAFPAFPPAFPSFLGMPVLLLIRFGDLGNSLL